MRIKFLIFLEFFSARLSRPQKMLVLLLFVGGALLTGSSGLLSEDVSKVKENSWLRVQNVGDTPALVKVAHYGYDGEQVAAEICPSAACRSVPAGSGWTFFTETNDDLPTQFYGSTKITGDQPFVAVAGRDFMFSKDDGWYLLIGGDTYWLGASGSKVMLPFVEHVPEKYSRIHVNNVSTDTPACVKITYYREGEMQPSVSEPVTAEDGCPEGGYYLDPNESMLRDAISLPVDLGFSGMGIVSSHVAVRDGFTVSVREQAIAAAVDTVSVEKEAFASYRGLSANEAGRDIVLPVIEREASKADSGIESKWTSKFRIAPLNPTIPYTVSFRYNGSTEGGAEFEAEQEFLAEGALTCDQGSIGTEACLPDLLELPIGFSGTVRISSAESMAVIVQRSSSNGAYGDYRGFTSREASTQVVLPVVNKTLAPWGGNDGWSSSVHVQPFDGGEATISFFYFSPELDANGLYRPMGRINGHQVFHQADDRFLPDDWVGSLVVVSTRPIVALASLESDAFKGDPVMMYNGVSLE